MQNGSFIWLHSVRAMILGSTHIVSSSFLCPVVDFRLFVLWVGVKGLCAGSGFRMKPLRAPMNGSRSDFPSSREKRLGDGLGEHLAESGQALLSWLTDFPLLRQHGSLPVGSRSAGRWW